MSVERIAYARGNLAAAKAKLAELIASGNDYLVETYPHTGLTEYHVTRAELEGRVRTWEGMVAYLQGGPQP